MLEVAFIVAAEPGKAEAERIEGVKKLPILKCRVVVAAPME